MIRPTMEEYDEFGVSETATPDDVKKQYRVKAARMHPDAGGDPEEFARMRELYTRILEASRTCQSCGGTGRVTVGEGWRKLKMPCEACNGKGVFE